MGDNGVGGNGGGNGGGAAWPMMQVPDEYDPKFCMQQAMLMRTVAEELNGMKKGLRENSQQVKNNNKVGLGILVTFLGGLLALYLKIAPAIEQLLSNGK